MITWVLRRSALALPVFRIVSPFGDASTSCWRPRVAAGLLMQEADGWLDTKSPWNTPFSSTFPSRVSRTIV
jgi:hypothetical protein